MNHQLHSQMLQAHTAELARNAEAARHSDDLAPRRSLTLPRFSLIRRRRSPSTAPVAATR